MKHDLERVLNDVLMTKMGTDDCPRCGSVHKELDWKLFERLVLGVGRAWAACPVTGDPILLIERREVVG